MAAHAWLVAVCLISRAATLTSNFYSPELPDEDVAGDLELSSGDYPQGSGELPPSPTAMAYPPPSVPSLPGPQVVSLAFVASGDVSSYTPSVLSDLRLMFAQTAGVDPEAVVLTVTSGSVLISVDIATASSSISRAVQSALAPNVATASALTTLLSSVPGITITVSVISAPLTIRTASSPPPAMPPSSGGLPTGALIGIIVGGVACVFLLVFVFYKSIQNLQNSPGHAPLTPRMQGKARGLYSQARQGSARASVEITASLSTAVKHGNMDII